MKIGIIGAGNVGRAIATLATAHGDQVVLSNSHGPETLAAVVAAIPGSKAGTVEEAAAFGEVVVLATPLKSYQSIPVRPLEGKIVIDAENYYPNRDGHFPQLDNNSTTSSEMVAAHLPKSKIVKAFNAIPMKEIEADARPAGAPDRRALPLAGNDAAAKKVVADLYNQFGFDVVDAGPLSESWRFQPGTQVYVTHLDRAGSQKGLADARRSAAARQ